MGDRGRQRFVFRGSSFDEVFPLQDAGQFHSTLCTVDHVTGTALVIFVSHTQRYRAIARHFGPLCVPSVLLLPLLTEKMKYTDDNESFSLYLTY